ncbi:DUF5410 family protein [Rickettsia typhi]|uniref:Uncharacterized protein n=2 Tax=Rickettsia typhi TaxID=785 RepID=Q68X12_RICTY|nr:DUF5410 family protein [Rickettsia typhi]AAU03830.1 rickettsial conserved hypothetical protein [Rickettsia typhi str. Wilmington]AFE54208.1 hypothetical protein RTTH1527_01715 [Rickettsia typhi str. TH1527]
MKLKEMIFSCIGQPSTTKKYLRSEQELAGYFNIYTKLSHKNLERDVNLTVMQNVEHEDKIFITRIINNILQKKITLDDLNHLKELKKGNKEIFLEYLQLLVCNDSLHELNQKIMQHAADLVNSQDLIFFLRVDNEDILRKLFYSEAKRNSFSVEINEEWTLKINFPSKILELYKLLINNFYLQNFAKEELQKKLYTELFPDFKIPFEQLIEEVSFFENFIECLKEFYIKNSLAQSIMFLLVSKYIEEHDVAKALFKSESFKKVSELEKFKPYYDINKCDEVDNYVFNCILNDVKGAYISNLASSILELVNHSQPDCEIVSIEILGNSGVLV